MHACFASSIVSNVAKPQCWAAYHLLFILKKMSELQKPLALCVGNILNPSRLIPLRMPYIQLFPHNLPQPQQVQLNKSQIASSASGRSFFGVMTVPIHATLIVRSSFGI